MKQNNNTKWHWWNPIWGFDFKVTISKHIVTMVPGQQISVPVTITLIRGKPQKLDLDVNTNWESMGLYAKVRFDFTTPMPEWTGTLEIKASPNTPPDSYLFTVRACAQGTFHTSEDAVTVVVEPKEKEKKEDKGKEPKEERPEGYPEDFFQPKQVAPDASASSGSASVETGSGFNLDNLFASSSPKPVAQSQAGLAGAKPPSTVGLVMGLIGIAVFTFILVWALQPTRRCIHIVLSSSGEEQCSDCSGAYEPTLINERSVGSCRAVTVRKGDICTLSCK